MNVAAVLPAPCRVGGRQGPDIAEYDVILHANALLCAIPHRTKSGAGVRAALLRRKHELADQPILDFQSTGARDHFGNLRRHDNVDGLAAGFLCLAWLDPDPPIFDLRFFQHADIDASRPQQVGHIDDAGEHWAAGVSGSTTAHVCIRFGSESMAHGDATVRTSIFS